MFNTILKYSGYYLTSSLLLGCYDAPYFPEEPSISFNQIEFVEVDGAADSLILTFNFEDGDGDLGLAIDEVYPPYHIFNYVVEEVDSEYYLIRYGQLNFNEPLILATSYDGEVILSGNYDFDQTLPEYGCSDYLVTTDVDTDEADTFLIKKNIFNKNIYVNFYKKIRGVYQLINDDFSQGGCVEFFNSRIPVFDQENIGKSLKGDVSFAMLSQGFQQTFRNDSIKMRFYIYDRNLNKSNIAETPDFVLINITRN